MELQQDREAFRLRRGALIFYYLSFIVITFLTGVSMFFGDLGDAVVGLPIVFIMGLAIFTDRRAVHIPPVMIVMVIAAFFLSLASRSIATDGSGLMLLLSNLLTGVNLGVFGLILVYILLKSMPGIRDEDHRIVSFIAVCISMAAYAMIRLIEYIISVIVGRNMEFFVDVYMTEMIMIICGSLIVAVLYGNKNATVFGDILNTFLEENSEVIGMGEMERSEVERIIEEGECERVEFKSTLRTNLETGEADKRMEKAVLKTIVAFLNSNGGNLLIGVADDGSILGADEASFDNRDKMNLHLNNLIKSRIGAEFLPQITVMNVEFDDKVVIRVKCSPTEKPVFLTDGKIEIFYVRNGSQTDELTGMALLDYVNNRKHELQKRKKRFS